MKKITTLLAAAGVVLASSTGCTKHPKPDIVKYTVNGQNYEVTGAYSDLDFKGIEKKISNNYLGFSAFDKHMLGVNCGIKFQNNVKTVFKNYDNTLQNPCMTVELNSSLPDRKTYISVTNRSGSFEIINNTTQFMEGYFSGWLFYMGIFGDEPISDSVEIINGYFYLNK